MLDDTERSTDHPPHKGPVLYVGDPHGALSHIVPTATGVDASAVVILGDLQAQRPLHEELGEIADRLWFIHGNHDTDTPADFEHLWDSRLADRNIHGRVVTLADGTRLAGLGGIFRGLVWDARKPHVKPRYASMEEHARVTPRKDRWRESVTLRHWSTIYPADVVRLAREHADVLVTHEAPSYHEHGFDELDKLARAMGAKTVVHGHHHDAIDSSARWEAQGFRSFGVGQAGITAMYRDGRVEVLVPGR